MRRRTFILMLNERGLKTEFMKKKCVGGLTNRFYGQTDGRNPILIASFAWRLKLPKIYQLFCVPDSCFNQVKIYLG